MDIELNCEINGFELTGIIKAKYRDTLVIILSQYDVPEYRFVTKKWR